jgi:hypothetical protein
LSLLLHSSYIDFDIIDPCTLYFKDDIDFALLIITSSLPDVWRFLLTIFPVRVSYMFVKHVIGR